MGRIDRRVGSIVQHESVNREVLVREISHDDARVVDAVGLRSVKTPAGRGRVVDRRECSGPQHERVRFVIAVDVAPGDVTKPVDIIQSCALRFALTGPSVTGLGVIDRRELTVVPEESVPNLFGIVVASDDVALGIEAPGARPHDALWIVDFDERVVVRCLDLRNLETSGRARERSDMSMPDERSSDQRKRNEGRPH